MSEVPAGQPIHLSRRQFVQTSAAAVAATAVPRAWGRGADEIRVGLIGCGGRGTGAATQALNADPGAVLWALGDVFPDRIETSLNNLTAHAPERVQVPPQRRFSGFDGYRGVLESGVDMVILTTPPHFRPVQLRAALEAGKHVFCEKPVAVDATGVRSVLESAAMADARRLNLMSGFCWRYSYPERATYKRLHEGAIGDIVAMHTTYHTGTLRQNSRRPEWSDMEWQLRNWFHFTWLSGDHIVEQACHAIDKINWAMQGRMPLRATALGGRQARRGAESGNVYDHFAVIYEYDGGVRCHHTCRQIDGCSNDNSDYIQGTRGRCFVNGWTPRHVIEGESPWSYEGPRRDMYQVEHDELFASIRGKAPRVNDGVSMAHSTLMAIMGRTAAYTGQTVTWEQALSASEDLTPAAYEFGPLPVAPVPIPGA